MRHLLPCLALIVGAYLLPSGANADVTVVEYYHSGFQHYFITPIADEIAKLDAHAPPFELWSRTGRTFRAYESSAAGRRGRHLSILQHELRAEELALLRAAWARV